jgi:hypothetical protein
MNKNTPYRSIAIKIAMMNIGIETCTSSPITGHKGPEGE